jgi:peptide/nickel transport system permease protein
MARFLIDRLLQSLLVLLVVSFFVYLLIGLMPGDPIDLMIQSNPNLTPADGERLRALYGLDQPIVARYWNWLSAALAGDFGYSRLFGQPVTEVVGPRLLNTLSLVVPVILLALAIAVPVGIYAARHPYTATDNAINLACFAGISVPPFWLALLLMIVFAVTLGWLPASGTTTEADPSLWERLRYMILPIATLTLLNIGHYTRHTRAAMIEVLGQDFIRTARAKGAGERRVVWTHALRNALIPLVTIVALDFGALFSGALVTETMFAYLGMGKLIYDSIMGNDFNVALFCLLLATFMILLGNLLADISYAALDPRVSFAGRRA